MATSVLMPQLGESVTEGTISKWLVKVGDVVNKYDPLCEVTTDKVNAEVPSTVSGKVAEIVVPEGETVEVGTLILYIDEGGAEAGDPSPGRGEVDASASVQPAESAGSARESTGQERDRSGKQRYSPAVMRLAQEHNLDLMKIKGTGAGGRITRKDVQKVVDQGGLPVEASQQYTDAIPANSGLVHETAEQSAHLSTAGQIGQGAHDVSTAEGDQVIPVSAIRRTIANRMVQSKHEAPHAWTMVEVDVTNLVQLRNRVKDEFMRKEGVNLTFLPFFIKAVVESLKEYPMLNATWAGDSIIVKKNINISIAVATDEALFVPVIKDADQKSIYGIARAVEDLAARTRAGKLTMDDMSGGTFTVNNTGSFGSVLSMPIINSPQAAILSVESIVKRPVVIEDMIAIRSMVNLCLSLDHRVLDGLICGRFLQAVKRRLESIGPDTALY
ncbi:2-oxo acid dehydrogenase subunit E2 [Brevibacillus humidisoli]|uniref:dihydrolipoamide acetyltransferase family protein n=1 Tax=Brevibacillus humidisoli TaxID=2895522 RepID=UPI001E49A9D0|nr:dihydrolipoamide acetyltransferase family protein [Brevibacillus humidisoli]UFJ42883.1 2-oxo acid dehydrogenase subunit E2 [Brevibacillus humidisoli]